ncbi:13430_t:CDS:1, partial [Dentiscutata erythropus]
LDNSIGEIMIKEKVGTKKAKGQIYDFILAHNPDTKRNTLYQRINRARKVYEFTEKIGVDKIKYIKTYNANAIADLSVSQIQTIIDYFSKNPNTELPDDQEGSNIDSEEEISDDQTDASEAVSAESPLPVSYDFNSS